MYYKKKEEIPRNSFRPTQSHILDETWNKSLFFFSLIYQTGILVIFQACLLSQVSRLAGNLCRPLCDANSHLTSLLLKQAAKWSHVAPRLCCKQTYCTASASVDAGVGQVSKEEEQFGKTKAKEIASMEILKNLSEDERIKLERLKTEYQSWKAEMRVVGIRICTIIWATSWQNQRNGTCAQQRLRSVWASAQSDQSSHVLKYTFKKKLRNT